MNWQSWGWAAVAIVLLAVIYESAPRLGGLLLLVLVFGMLLTAQRNGTIHFTMG